MKHCIEIIIRQIKCLTASLILLLFISPISEGLAAGTSKLPLIPWPQKVERHRGDFTLTTRTRIYHDWGTRQTADLFAERLRRSTGYPLPVHMRFFTGRPIRGAILLTTRDANPHLGSEGYELTISPDSVVLRARSQAGLFYGTRTLLQLLPAEIFSSSVVSDVPWEIPCVHIEDWPRFKWRGLMLDVSRHFYTKSEVEHILSLMALYKMNRFHWHLTDDQGWRIEIPQYPRLTEIGAWRKHWRFEPLPAQGANAQPAWDKPAANKFAPDGLYGGFYTPQDIREVVAYAAARHITVVPEIEMPGHSGAAMRAYPQFGCTNVPAGLPHNVYDPANPATYKFLENVLREVFRLFPGKYVHIGGDEVPVAVWSKSPDCVALMKKRGMTNVMQLQSYFLKHIEKFVHAHGKTMIGWSEILKGGLAPNAVVMDWIGGAKEAASEGHDVVMTPGHYCYFDHYQSKNHKTEPQAIGGYLPLKRVYSFEPIPAGLPAQDDRHILGAQANLWGEFIPSLAQAEYMIFPRLCALAEVDWSPQELRNWPGFQQRLRLNERTLKQLGVNYRRPGGVK